MIQKKGNIEGEQIPLLQHLGTLRCSLELAGLELATTSTQRSRSPDTNQAPEAHTPASPKSMDALTFACARP
jgi:hypothetical protein